MMADYWAHHYFNNPKARDEVEDEDFNLDAELARIEAEDDAANELTDWEKVE